MMSKTYEDEQKQLQSESKGLQQEIEVPERQIENLEQLIRRVQSHTELKNLTPYAQRTCKGCLCGSAGKRKQKIHIEYGLASFIPVDELIKAEQA